MHWCLKPIVLVCLTGGAAVFGGDHFRVKARLLPGAPASVNYRHSDVVSRGTLSAMLEREEVVEDLNFVRRTLNPALDAKATTKVIRKVFRSATRDVATTVEILAVDAAPIRLNDIHLAAYSDRRVHFTGRIQNLPKEGAPAANEKTAGCRVTIFVRGFGSTEVASTATNPNGPLLFECKQCFWMSNGEDYAISLICPEDLRLCESAYQELTHLQIEVETRRNR